jgi:tetratricopeptide (TPR) repeat protein
MNNRVAPIAIFVSAAAMAVSAQSPGFLSWRTTVSSADQLSRAGRFLDAERTLQSALEQARQLEPDLAPEATTYSNLGSLYRDRRLCDEAARAYQRSLHLWEKIGPSGAKYFLSTANNLVGLYLECGNLGQAERHQRMLVEPRLMPLSRVDPEFARNLTNLGCIELLKGRNFEARDFYQQALMVTEQISSKPSADLAGALNNFALVLMRTGRADQAIEYNRRAVAVLDSIGAPIHPMLVSVLANGAHMNCMLHRCSEAEPLIQRL